MLGCPTLKGGHHRLACCSETSTAQDFRSTRGACEIAGAERDGDAGMMEDMTMQGRIAQAIQLREYFFPCWSLQAPGLASFWLMTSMAKVECAMAPPARISAATQIASMISCSVAPFSFACLVWLRMQ